jgi:hypothetical protein
MSHMDKISFEAYEHVAKSFLGKTKPSSCHAGTLLHTSLGVISTKCEG